MTHPSITSEKIDNVLCISVDDGKANAFSISLLEALGEELAKAEADADIRAVVLAGNTKVFVAGFDLDVINSGDPVRVTELVAAGGSFIRQVYGASLPVVAASTGHAVAAGALLLLGCDYRVGVDGPVREQCVADRADLVRLPPLMPARAVPPRAKYCPWQR